MASFKTDESFLEKIAIGAIGTQQVFSKLKQLGHQPIELERGSMNYKLWKRIKIKRIRVPDILCIDTGIRIESRAKTKLEISMSHSVSDPERGWDSGMKDDDYIALVVCEKFDEKPIDWKAGNLVQFVSVKDLRQAEQQNQTVLEKPKGAQEGFEARIIWPASVASADGIVTETGNTVKYKTIGRTNTIRLMKKEKNLCPIVKVGDKVLRNQILASVVNVNQVIPTKKVSVGYFLDNLDSLVLSERYAAAKALSYFHDEKVTQALQKKLRDQDEHIYVKLEVAASLSRFEIIHGYDYIRDCLKDNYLQNVLEAVIVLAEIKTDIACQMLCEILLDKSFNPEIRAGAVWGLGEQNNKSSLETIIASFNFVEENIRIESARALAKLAKNFNDDILSSFQTASPGERPGISWALTRSLSLNLDQLLPCLNELDSRHWISYIIGTQGEECYVTEIEKLKDKDSEVYFAVTLLWKIMTSWIYDLKEY